MISKDEVLSLSTLARLKLSDSEVPGLQKDISNILEYVGQVSAISVDTVKEKPLQRNIMREDLVRAVGDTMANKAESLRVAFPKREGDFNVVRKIIQKDE